jgi:hypothetical protein
MKDCWIFENLGTLKFFLFPFIGCDSVGVFPLIADEHE